MRASFLPMLLLMVTSASDFANYDFSACHNVCFIAGVL